MADQSLRAEVLLIAQLAGLHSEHEEPDEWPEDEGPRREFHGALEAVERAGLLSAERAGWLRELDERLAGPPPRVKLTGEQRERVERLLVTLDERDRQDATDILARLGAFPMAGGPSDVVETEEAWPEPLLRLKAVLPGGRAVDGARVFAVECYDGGILVRWELARAIPAELRDASAERVRDHFYARESAAFHDATVTDDAGTRYVPGGGHWGGHIDDGRWVTEMTSTFDPGLPAGTTTLTVAIAGRRFEFDVTGVAERPGV